MAQLRRIEVVRINEQVYEAVEAAIVRCELEPGAVLGDRQLAEMLGVSRTPVRDALHRLESSGLVERRGRSEEHTSELQSRQYLVCRLLLEKKKNRKTKHLNSSHVNISYAV